MFRRSERHEPAPDEATFAARNAATQGFLALDDEQRAAADTVRVADELAGDQRSGRALAPEWAQVSAACDRATEAYLAATQQFPLDGSASARGARAADEKALRDIEAARDAIRRFHDRHSRQLDEASMLVRNLPQTVQQARVALTTARAAVAEADAAGVPSRRASQRLAEAEQAVSAIDTASGLRERSGVARRATDLAHSAAALAAEAPKTAASVRSALRSVATRSEAATTKVERIEPALSALRREFSEPCSHDLVDAEREATAAIAAARTVLATATRLAGSGDWDDAADAIATARSELGRAEGRQEAVVDRLAMLREVRKDPAKEAAEVRFVLRDAQRLVVDRGMVARFGSILDAQSVRLDNARERLTGVHPDYWLYLTELNGVRERVKQVVADVRAAQRR